MRFVFHMDDKPAECRIDGHSITIPPGELFEVPQFRGMDWNGFRNFEYIIPENDVAEIILRDCRHSGMIDVPVSRDRTSLRTEDDASLRERAAMALRDAELKCVESYVVQQQDRKQQNSPALKPEGRVLGIIRKHGIDLRAKYNLEPIGHGDAEVAESKAAQAAELAELRRQMAEMQTRMAAMLAQKPMKVA